MNQPIVFLIMQGLATLETPDQIADRSAVDRTITLLNQIDRLKQITRELTKQVEAAAIAVIDTHGEIECGDVRWYVGTEKKVKCTNKADTLTALLLHECGDMDGVCDKYMTSEPFKPSVCREALGDTAAQLFAVQESPELKEGKPLRGLQRMDRRFVKVQ